eukprot:8818176-Pyramimonas_sp.AAC.1
MLDVRFARYWARHGLYREDREGFRELQSKDLSRLDALRGVRSQSPGRHLKTQRWSQHFVATSILVSEAARCSSGPQDILFRIRFVTTSIS